jgi:hypothetical protein
MSLSFAYRTWLDEDVRADSVLVARNIGSYTTLSNRTNNIIDPNADVTKSKVLIDPLLWGLLQQQPQQQLSLLVPNKLEDCWRREKLTLIFFWVTPKTSFKGLFF